jgi:riboflavin kinase/FMN adenylyltransferase
MKKIVRPFSGCHKFQSLLMQFFDSLASFAPATHNGRALAIGTFDGVHCGHAALVARLNEAAAARELSTAVLTFTDLPYRFFHPEATARLLTLPQEKRAAFAALQPDELWLLDFDESIARQSARAFAQNVLRQKLDVRLLVCGPDFALGAGRGGDVAALRELGSELGFEVLVLGEKINHGEAAISSTRIREGIERGEVEDGAQMLGRAYSFEGEVVSGQKLGRTIGFPTINVQPHALKVLPAYGVYAVRAHWEENDATVSYNAALNIGLRPTVDGTRQQIEFHVLDETIEEPPARASIEFIARLRDERKFENLQALAAQLQKDVESARAVLRSQSTVESDRTR